MATVDDLEEVLRRTNVQRGQITLLKALYENTDGFVSGDELATQIRGGDLHSYNSILGAFSRRVNETPRITGSPGYEVFVETKLSDHGTKQYRLRDEARRAIEGIDPFYATLKKPMSELREPGTEIPADDLRE